MKLTDKSIAAWQFFLQNQDNKGHVNRQGISEDIEAHAMACFDSAKNTVQRIQKDIPNLAPTTILEIGSSTGINCFQLHAAFSDSVVYGIESEREAIAVAESMIDSAKERLSFIWGVGEQLPFADESIDLIVCHTVIEHVNNVELVVKEMSRVLSQSGRIHLDAPNYIWPYEPHLKIFCIPMLGKNMTKWFAFLQGKRQEVRFLNHLRFVTPRLLESHFKSSGLFWINRVEAKLNHALIGDINTVVAYQSLSRILNILNKLGVGKLSVWFILKLGLYPSVLYTLSKNDVDE